MTIELWHKPGEYAPVDSESEDESTPYAPLTQAACILNCVITEEDQENAFRDIRKMGLDPNKIPSKWLVK